MKRKFTLLLAVALCLTALVGGCAPKEAAPTDPPPMSEAPATLPPTPEPTPEPTPTPETTPTPRPGRMDYQFDTTSKLVDSNAGYDFYVKNGSSVVRRDPGTGEEETIFEGSGNISYFMVIGAMQTYADALGDDYISSSFAVPGEALAQWEDVKDTTGNATTIYWTSSGMSGKTSYYKTCMGRYETRIIENVENWFGCKRIGNSWMRGGGQIYWLGDAPQQGTEEVARWADLLTDNIAVTVMDWQYIDGLERPEGSGQYCVAAQDPDGGNLRLLWDVPDGTNCKLDAIIQDKLLFHMGEGEDWGTNYVYDLTTGEMRVNDLVSGEVMGYTPSSVYIDTTHITVYQASTEVRPLDYSAL